LGALSPTATVAGRRENSVFTHTQMTQGFNIFALAFCAGTFRNLPIVNQKSSDADDPCGQIGKLNS
jgi:hypothetical protein